MPLPFALARICIFLLAVAATSAAAGPDRLSVLVGTHHINPRDDFEEFNPGLLLSWEEAVGAPLLPRPLDVNLGVFRNSYGRTATLATAGYPFFRGPGGELSAFFGLAHYPVEGRTIAVHVGDVIPIAGLSARRGHLFAVMIPCFCAYDVLVSGGVTFDTDQLANWFGRRGRQ